MVRSVDQAEVNLPISAVIEAIDRLQAETHHDDAGRIFAGDLSLSTSYNNEPALQRIMQAGEVGVASRPRRCFIMSLYIGGPLLTEFLALPRGEDEELPRPVQRPDREIGHHLLGVVQEKSSEEAAPYFYASF